MNLRDILLKQALCALLVDAMNPCPCGFYGDSQKPCTCTPAMVTKYQKRISGPLLDRIDMKTPLHQQERLGIS